MTRIFAVLSLALLLSSSGCMAPGGQSGSPGTPGSDNPGNLGGSPSPTVEADHTDMLIGEWRGNLFDYSDIHHEWMVLRPDFTCSYSAESGTGPVSFADCFWAVSSTEKMPSPGAPWLFQIFGTQDGAQEQYSTNIVSISANTITGEDRTVVSPTMIRQ